MYSLDFVPVQKSFRLSTDFVTLAMVRISRINIKFILRCSCYTQSIDHRPFSAPEILQYSFQVLLYNGAGSADSQKAVIQTLDGCTSHLLDFCSFAYMTSFYQFAISLFRPFPILHFISCPIISDPPSVALPLFLHFKPCFCCPIFASICLTLL